LENDQVTVIVLAGGKSRRLGVNKAFLGLDGQTLIEGVNVLTNPVFDPTAKIPEYKVAACRVKKIKI